MKGSRWINRFLSSLLAAAMLFALTAGAVPAFAEGEGDPAAGGEETGEPFDWEQESGEILSGIRDTLQWAVLNWKLASAVEKSGKMIVFGEKEVVVYTGGTRTPGFSVEAVDPAGAATESEIPPLKWNSADPAVASVNGSGVIKGVSAGKTYVYCSSADGSLFGYVRVVVRTAVTGLRLSENEIDLLLSPADPAAASARLGVTILPENAYSRKVTWSSDDESIAAVDADGNVKALRAGRTTIRVSAGDQGTGTPVTAKCDVTVRQAVTGIDPDRKELTLNVREKARLSAVISPADASEKTVTWTSSDTSVAAVDDKGQVTAKASGTAVITCTATDDTGLSGSGTVHVIKGVTSVKIMEKDVRLYVRDTMQLTVTVSPADATEKNLTWSSSDSSVVKVDANGKIEALKAGTATVVCTAGEGDGKSASVRVTVAVFTAQDVAKDIEELAAAPAKQYGVKYKMIVDGGDSVTVEVYADELSLISTLAKLGNKEAKDKWNGLIASLEEVSAAVQERADQKATDKVTVTIVLYDSGKSTKYAAFRNGSTIYDKVNGIDIAG